MENDATLATSPFDQLSFGGLAIRFPGNPHWSSGLLKGVLESVKIDCLDHPKTIDLATRLGICLPQAIGHLELLWAFVAQKTPQGDIGKWSNAVISHAAQWTNDPDLFVQSMTDSGFFDEDSDHRLLIHDWAEHRPNWVQT